MDIVAYVVVALVAGAVGFALGRSGGGGADASVSRSTGAEDAADRIRSVARSLARGEVPSNGAPGSPEAELARALEAGWAPRAVEHQRALREALSRVGGFLDRSVREPLSGVEERTSADELRERIGRALGALEDLEFYLKEPEGPHEGQNISSLVQQVTREFALDQGVMVRLKMEGPIRASVNAQAFMDAVYLVLHNAARFGDEGTVDVSVVSENDRAVVRVRDRGDGFSEEAFRRAFDPFYSTTDDGLGLGLPHARKSLETMGGHIELRNAPDGGAEVEVSFPAA